MKEDELPATEIFSPVLIEEYIRLMTASHCIKAEDKFSPALFKINKDTYTQIKTYPLQAPFIGLSLSYDEAKEVLSVTPQEEFIKQYENKIQEEVALNFAIVNTKRYSKWISVISD